MDKGYQVPSYAQLYRERIVHSIEEAALLAETGDHRAALTRCRATIEIVVEMICQCVFREDYHRHGSLANALRDRRLEEFLPRRLIVMMLNVKELGDAAAHSDAQFMLEDTQQALRETESVWAFVSDTIIRNDLDFIMSHPCLEIEIEPSLDWLRFVYRGNSLHIERPVLLLESVGGKNKRFALEDRQLSTANAFDVHPLASVISKNIGKRNRIVFGEVEVLWDSELCTWPPSIDTLFAGSLLLGNRHLANLLSDCHSFAEIGCGTGFIASLVARHYEPERIVLSDLDDDIVRLARYNVLRNRRAQNVEIRVGSAFAPLMFAGRRLDVIFSNPPYIILDPGRLEAKNPTVSTGLLGEIIMEFDRYGDRLLLCYSSCAGPWVQKVIELRAAGGHPIRWTRFGQKKVPFRVYNVDDASVDTLLERNLLIDLKKTADRTAHRELAEDNRGFRFWHEIELCLFESCAGPSHAPQ